MQTNPTCANCDYFNACNKKLIFSTENNGEVHVTAKNQVHVKMKCLNVVQDVCRDCQLFIDRKCASWKILNGKEYSKGTLRLCPKKVPLLSTK
jgi:hypothetical protein